VNAALSVRLATCYASASIAKSADHPDERDKRGLDIDGLHHVPHATVAAGHALPVSELVPALVRAWPDEALTVGELIPALGHRGHGVLIVLFALPNLLPFYLPGLSPAVGVPLLIVCAQLALGFEAPRLARLLALPTPLTNGPPALACLVMAVGRMEEDSVTMVAGVALGVFAAILSLSILASLGWALAGGFQWLFGWS
jgi:hypothetical protein